MKKISIFMLSIIICITYLLPINALGYLLPDNYKWEYEKSSAYYEKTKAYDTYLNVNIDNILYSITRYYPGEDYELNANFAKTKGDTLKFPETIFFKGKRLKVKEIKIDDWRYNISINAKWKMPYKNIIIPNSVEEADFTRAKFTKLKKIYVSKNTRLISGLSDYPKLKVIIDKKNPYIKMKNGAIYSKNGKELLTLVNSKKKYRVSKGTKRISLDKVKTVEKVYLPASLKKISVCAFEDCRNLKTVKINNKTNIIDTSAFENCTSLKKITIPKNVKKIKYWAFKDCAELSKVKIENQEKSPKIEDTAFQNTKDGIQFIVKNQTVADQLKEQLNGSGVKSAKILVGKKVVHQNING